MDVNIGRVLKEKDSDYYFDPKLFDCYDFYDEEQERAQLKELYLKEINKNYDVYFKTK